MSRLIIFTVSNETRMNIVYSIKTFWEKFEIDLEKCRNFLHADFAGISNDRTESNCERSIVGQIEQSVSLGDKVIDAEVDMQKRNIFQLMKM